MKMLVAVALVATSLPVLTATAFARDGDSASGERRVCTNVAVRAGSRMSGRRVCKSAAEWRGLLGADWRQRLAGYTGTQDDYDAVQARGTASYDGTGGVAPVSSRGGVDPR
jgi:hypothetical protein